MDQTAEPSGWMITGGLYLVCIQYLRRVFGSPHTLLGCLLLSSGIHSRSRFTCPRLRTHRNPLGTTRTAFAVLFLFSLFDSVEIWAEFPLVFLMRNVDNGGVYL